MSDAYERITWRGHTFDRMTVQAIEAAEELLGFKFDIAQGSYSGGGVAQSAGTHDGGGAFDAAPTDVPSRVVRVLRVVGFAAWLRTSDEGPWGDHIHAVLNGNARLSPSAARQVESYKAGRNGLRSNLPDPTWRPNPIKPYVYREDWFEMASKEELSDLIDERLRAFFRDSDGGAPDATNLRIQRKGDGVWVTLGHLAQQVDNISKGGK